MTKMKVCHFCHLELPVTDFGAHKRTFDGYTSRCRRCINSERRKTRTSRRETLPEGTKRCTGCKRILDINRFYVHNKRTGALRPRCKECLSLNGDRWGSADPGSRTRAERECRATRGKEWRAQRWARVDALKNAPCTDCGRTFHFTMMEWDHVRGEKTRAISTMRTNSMESIMREIEKCDLVCVLCHRARTWNRKHQDDQITSDPI